MRQVRAEPDPTRIIEMFAHTVRTLQERVAPLIAVLNAGAETDADWRAFAEELSSRRVGHRRAFVEDVAAKGGFRADLPVDMAADAIWIMNSPSFYLLCVRGRGWSPELFERWLADTWKRLLLSAHRKTAS